MMKNRHLQYVISMGLILIGSSMSYAETHELGSPLPGRILVKIHSDVISKRMQISGSLNPLRIFINGQERTSELKPGHCPEESAVNLNGKSIETKGGPGIFFWEGTQDQDKLSLSIKSKEKCLAMESTIPLAFFEKPFHQEVYLSEKAYPATWDIKLEGEKVSGVSVKMDQGNLQINDKWVFTHVLKPGTNIVTGILKDQSGKETPLLLKFYFKIESAQENVPGLVLNFPKEGSEEKLEATGKVNKGNKLLLNGDEVEISDQQEFIINQPLEIGENNFNFESINTAGEKTTFSKSITRVERPVKNWPILPDKSYVGLGIFNMHAMKSTESDLRVKGTHVSHFVYGTKLGAKQEPWEFFFRFVEQVDLAQERNEGSVMLKNHIGFGALKLYPWKKALHFGVGLSYERLVREANTFNSNDSDNYHDLHIIGRIGWMKKFGNHWAWMPSFSPFIAIPLGKSFETFGFDLLPFMLVYSF